MLEILQRYLVLLIFSLPHLYTVMVPNPTIQYGNCIIRLCFPMKLLLISLYLVEMMLEPNSFVIFCLGFLVMWDLAFVSHLQLHHLSRHRRDCSYVTVIIDFTHLQLRSMRTAGVLVRVKKERRPCFGRRALAVFLLVITSLKSK